MRPSLWLALDPVPRAATSKRFSLFARLRNERRYIQLDHRNRLSNIWVPAPQVSLKDVKKDKGFLRQAHSGVFHMLPLGVRVQDKIEALIDKHMKAIGGSRVSLSSISSAKLWKRSGRLESVKSELFQFKDRKDAQYLLSPTHEEEITELVSQNVQSYRGLPLRLYQITRKYRDEMRPRHGILRGREFIMKDMYSFDTTVAEAMATYVQVREAYAAIFSDLNVPVLAAKASSGDMGGDLSHEYHLAASLGEDFVAHCSNCDYVANTEVLEESHPAEGETECAKEPIMMAKYAQAWRGISKDRTTLVNVWYPAEAVHTTTGEIVRMTEEDIDTHAVKTVVPDLDSGIENTTAAWNDVLVRARTDAETGLSTSKPTIVNLVDQRLSDMPINTYQWPLFGAATNSSADDVARYFDVGPATITDSQGRSFNFAKPRTGDNCPHCHGHGTLVVERCIELGHTFYLGTRYTSPYALDVKVQAAEGNESVVPVMGCYGLGLSRILGAVADHMMDQQGLNWPRAIAPYEVVVIAAPATAKDDGLGAVAEGVYDTLAERSAQGHELDVLLDDRTGASLAYKLNDADLTGYPIVVVVGKAWRKSVGDTRGLSLDGLCEVQCRRLDIKQNVPLRELRSFVNSLVVQL